MTTFPAALPHEVRAAFTAVETFRVETYPEGYSNCRVVADASVSGLSAKIAVAKYRSCGLVVEVYSNADGKRVFA